ncbi:MAG: hypothetical protein K1X74_12935 [Pirellulales bacterium]|nr:hypothetical protein [Pirellulales bacterium]
MLSRRLLLPVVAATAVAGPYLYYESGDLLKPLEGLVSASSAGDNVLSAAQQYLAASQSPSADGQLPRPELVPLEEALQFGITPQWVMRRWARVSTQLADLDLQGYRVTLVSGTQPSDVAGSLTYYFDRGHQLQRIELHGTTGEPGRIAALVSHVYGLKRTVGERPGEVLFRESWAGQTGSELSVVPAEIVRTEMPHARFVVDLKLTRPRGWQ